MMGNLNQRVSKMPNECCTRWLVLLTGKGNIGILGPGNIRSGERKISKKGNIAMALPIAMVFTPMERVALLQPLHQALRFP